MIIHDERQIKYMYFASYETSVIYEVSEIKRSWKIRSLSGAYHMKSSYFLSTSIPVCPMVTYMYTELYAHFQSNMTED